MGPPEPEAKLTVMPDEPSTPQICDRPGLGTVRCVVEHANAWLLANKRLNRRNDRSTVVIDGLLTAACIFVIANRLTDF